MGHRSRDVLTRRTERLLVLYIPFVLCSSILFPNASVFLPGGRSQIRTAPTIAYPFFLVKIHGYHSLRQGTRSDDHTYTSDPNILSLIGGDVETWSDKCTLKLEPTSATPPPIDSVLERILSRLRAEALGSPFCIASQRCNCILAKPPTPSSDSVHHCRMTWRSSRSPCCKFSKTTYLAMAFKVRSELDDSLRMSVSTTCLR